ncbi:FadR family transcriptional regulator [Mucilaginibacter conchicola]|uniref:FadR family transcriptional regulator n=1 Tax=Mucilaginibacter conchicola TaxID=2303333 RepID=A0A372P0C8_9SPHI|nr:FadR/GntR family transcriptional regulator [Mucilaginibacter conchicola]RFZ95826.1 FadR family transcriptional regulator [Mucilaginibacter conchicola]
MSDVKLKLSDQISRKIQDDIAGGRFKTGEKLPTEPELMKMYSVGRSSIREAVKALAMAGILTVQQGAGTTVNADRPSASINDKIRHAKFDEVNAVRNLLEKEIIALAVQNRNEEQLVAMQQWLNKRRTAIENNERQQCMDADIGFHQTIASASGNTVLADLYQSFTDTIRHFFKEREKQGVSHFAFSHHLHEQLFNAIKSKKGKQAQEVLQQILNNNY